MKIRIFHIMKYLYTSVSEGASYFRKVASWLLSQVNSWQVIFGNVDQNS